jgi:alkylation response protein AidB-like acyl-CoA dehydrogenase
LAGPVPSFEAWLARVKDAPYETTIDRALWAGFEADRLGYAFVGGYFSALERLLGEPSAPEGKRSKVRRCLAATESGGAHPKAIQTKLEDGALNGEKTFATLATHADELLVVASIGIAADGRNQLVLVKVPANAKGVTIAPRSPTPFAPEIPHSRVKLENVETWMALAGDAYTNYLKPFRTIEDTHVLGATLGYLVAVARRSGWNHAFVEGALAGIVALRAVAAASPLDPMHHLALSGIFTALRRLIAEHEAEWGKADAAERERWQRDVGLLLVAEQARTKRTEAAWGTLAPS